MVRAVFPLSADLLYALQRFWHIEQHHWRGNMRTRTFFIGARLLNSPSFCRLLALLVSSRLRKAPPAAVSCASL